MRLVTAREMQEIDRRTIDGGHVPSLVLMERAGRAAAAAVLHDLQSIATQAGDHRRVEILCGKGNNGGDGLVIARALAEQDVPVRVHLTHAADSMSPDARVNHRKLEGTKVEVTLVPDELPEVDPVVDPRDRPAIDIAVAPPAVNTPATREWLEGLCDAAVCVDALLGTGVGDPLRGRFATLVDTVNRCSRHTLAVDIPSGVDGTTGRVQGTAVWADHTVTIGLPKLGLALHPGRERAGTIEIADIGFPMEVIESVAPAREWVDRHHARGLLPRIDPVSHKYDRGCVVVLAGSRAFTGAAVLAATAALRVGAGIVHLVVPASVRALMQTKTTEVIVHGVSETPDGTLAPGCEAEIEPLLARADSMAVGSGFGPIPSTLEWIADFLRRTPIPAVVDADAIGVLPPPPHPAARVATPHAGELARWSGAKITGPLERLEIAVRTAAAEQVVVLAKGAPTFVVAPSGSVAVNATGNIGLATAGSGDVLAGVVAGLLATGCEPARAAALGVWLHGRTAELAVPHRARRSLVAGDLLESIGAAIFDLEAAPGVSTH